MTFQVGMSAMCKTCRGIKINLRSSHFYGDISGWDVSNVESMFSMFFNSPFNGDISGWDVSNVQNMEGMFDKSQFNAATLIRLGCEQCRKTWPPGCEGNLGLKSGEILSRLAKM